MTVFVALPPPPPAIIFIQQPSAKTTPQATIPCDETGIIRCSITETVTANRSIEDLRIIAKYIWLVSERNRTFYQTWKDKLPSAAYEVVRRIHPFPYLPYGDMYGITDMQLILQEGRDRIIVRYPKRPDKMTTEMEEVDYATYETNLTAFMKVIEKEIVKLKKYEKQ